MSEEQAPAKITVSEAIRQAIAAGCQTTASIVSSVQAVTGKVPSPSSISQIRKRLGSPASNGRGRPRKSAAKVVPAAAKGQESPVNIASAHAPQAITAIQSTSAEDFLAIAKAIQPFKLRFSSDSLLSLVKEAIKL